MTDTTIATHVLEADAADVPFRVLGAGTLACKFHLLNNALRHEAASYGLIHGRYCIDEDETDPKTIKRAQRSAVFTLMQLVASFEAVESRIDDIGEELDEPFASLFSALREEKLQLQGLAKQARERGELPWELIPHAYCKGDEVVIQTDDAVHGAEIISATRRESMFGPFMAVSFRFFSFDGRRFRWAHHTKNIPAFDGNRKAEQIGIEPISPERSIELLAQGERFATFCSSPSYLRYEGALTRRSWRGDKRFRATGRAMLDLRSMKEMDPGYDDYYGEFDEDEEGGIDVNHAVDDKQKRLASPYVYGFSFLCKAWGEMLVTGMSSIKFRKDSFDKLVLDESRKRLIEALVRQNSGGFSDLIEGKGGGCIFLLHGQPGVGKTLTAEAIAERLERPLYMVGAGELGITPDELEDRLKSVLDTAHAWNAVLLIDEADIFLERRAQSDVARNAMVGIFLRLLEYHQGILFLTTNRVADIDDAFLSRVSVGLNYEALGESDRAMIWRNLLESTESFDLNTIDTRELGQLDINGRQIKHCIRLGLALAQSENRQATSKDLFDMAKLAMEFKKDFSKAREHSEAKAKAS
jgi:hypothetical protein